MRVHHSQLDINFGKAGERQFDIECEYHLAGDKPIIRTVTGWLLDIDPVTKRTIRVPGEIDFTHIVDVAGLEDEISGEMEAADTWARSYHARTRYEEAAQ
jgi:hypothetical protein